MATVRSLSDSDLAEVRVLLQRKEQLEAEIKHENETHKQKITAMKLEWHELCDIEMGKNYDVSKSVIRLIRLGRTYKQVKLRS